MNTNDDKTPSSFDMGDDSSKSLAEIIAEEERSDAEQDKIINREKNKKRNKKVIIFSSAFLLLTGITVGTVVFNPFSGDQKVGTNEQNMVQVDGDKDINAGKGGEGENDANKPKDDGDLPFYIKDDKIVLPIDQMPWQEKAYSTSDKNELNQDILKQVADTSIGTAANTLPSEASGYTSNTESEFLPDGSINPDFSYWTLENYSAEVGSYIERLINPTFGGWSSAQYASSPANKSLNYEELADMFTSDWLTANTEKPYSEYMPVFADWNGNNYGMGDSLLETGPRWYGEVVDSTSEFSFNDEKEQYTVDLTANIKFTAWSKDGSKLEKTGTLTLKLVSNAEGLNDNSSNRVLIDGASLKVDG